MKSFKKQAYALLLVCNLFFFPINSFAGDYVNSITWKPNAMLSLTEKGWITSSITFFVDSKAGGSYRIGDTVRFTDSDKNFKITMIYKDRTSISNLRNTYTQLFSDVKNVANFNDIIAGYNDNNSYKCFIGWSRSKEPEEYLAVNPCR